MAMKNNKEIWKDVPGYEGSYQASNFGRVRSLDRTFIDITNRRQVIKGKILKQSIDKYGYYVLALSNKQFKVHRIIGLTFLPNMNNLPQINHKDGNKLNNHVTNLEWSSPSHNVKHAFDTGLEKPYIRTEQHRLIKRIYNATNKAVYCVETDTIYISREAASSALNVYTEGILNSIRTGKDAKGYHFKDVQK